MINGVTLGPNIQYLLVILHGNLLHRGCFSFIDFSTLCPLPLIFSLIGRKMRSTDSNLDASSSCGIFAKGESFMTDKYLNHELYVSCDKRLLLISVVHNFYQMEGH